MIQKKRIKPEEIRDPILREKLRKVILDYLSMGLNMEQIRQLLGFPTQDELIEFRIKKVLNQVFGGKPKCSPERVGGKIYEAR